MVSGPLKRDEAPQADTGAVVDIDLEGVFVGRNCV